MATAVSECNLRVDARPRIAKVSAGFLQGFWRIFGRQKAQRREGKRENEQERRSGRFM